jgi:hypothetical protein
MLASKQAGGRSVLGVPEVPYLQGLLGQQDYLGALGARRRVYRAKSSGFDVNSPMQAKISHNSCSVIGQYP